MYWWVWVLIIGLIILPFLLLLILSLLLTWLTLYRKSAWCTDKKPWIPRYEKKEDMDRALASMDWYRHNGEDVWIKSYDGIKLHGKYFRKKDAKKTILLFHGYRGIPEGDFCLVNEWLRTLDVSFLEVDQRGHCLSEGKHITMGVKEQHDVHSWVEYLLNLNDDSIYLWGMSMGATSVLLSLKEPFPNRVKGVIADCGFYSPYKQMEHMIIQHKGAFVVPLLNWLCGIWTSLVLRVNIRKVDTRKILVDCKMPIFFAHGMKDNFVPYFMSQRNFDACSSEKYLLLVPDAAHSRSFFLGGDNFKEKALIILEK
ncbi:MAG TPA: alpha/beta hydrolase [Bacilli bacterium]|mgnify:CR=1 FL=1|nr:alpha/beta hydrolase [Bacilli bacterium]HPS19222.1 alpha/beta hydrolase [Bacilli bacterium]